MEKPIVATDVPGCREIVEDGLNGRLVPAKNAVALADAIEELIHNQALRKKMGEAGREKVIREFDATAVAKKTIEVYGSFASLRNQP
jgi:glycosyltransferase involved in cell wall biosynthesis